jgi:hypothetical protein
MLPTSIVYRLTGLIAMALLSMTIVLPAQAAPAMDATPARSKQDRCLPKKRIDQWSNRRNIEARGFNFDLVGAQANATFSRNLSLDLSSDPASAAYTASRITEIDTWLPIDQRVKCWQATAKKDVVVEFRVRFDQPAAPQGLTENLILWNAPFPSTTPEPLRPVTSIGVSRNSAFGQPQYVALATQDLDYATFAPPFILQVNPMPPWLDAGDWHQVRMTITQTTAQIDVAQGNHTYTSVLNVTLLHPAEPLGFEFSVDNELAPGYWVPVTIPDSLKVDYLNITLQPKQ